MIQDLLEALTGFGITGKLSFACKAFSNMVASHHPEGNGITPFDDQEGLEGAIWRENLKGV
jgi:hypothetical protein